MNAFDRTRPRSPSPPTAARRPHRVVQHGIGLVDDYAWLRADNWQEVMRDPAVLDPEIRAYLEAENAYTQTALAGTQSLQDTLFAEMKARIKEDDSTVPAADGPWEYYTSFVVGGQYPRICRRPRGARPRPCASSPSCSSSPARPLRRRNRFFSRPAMSPSPTR